MSLEEDLVNDRIVSLRVLIKAVFPSYVSWSTVCEQLPQHQASYIHVHTDSYIAGIKTLYTCTHW